MTPAKTFRDLICWQKAHEFVLGVYRLVESFPKHELYGLRSQLTRAAVSVPANIAEGFRRKTPVDKCRFINIAQSSLEEARYYLILAEDLNYTNTTQCQSLAEEASKIIDAYSKAITRNAMNNSDS